MSYNPIHLVMEWLMTSFCFVFIHFIVYGVIIAFITKTIAEKFLRKDERSQMHSPAGGHTIEPMYSFDIHCNGFFPIILFNYFGNVSVVLLFWNSSDVYYLSLVLNDAIRFESVVEFHFQSIIYIRFFIEWIVHYGSDLLLLPDV